METTEALALIKAVSALVETNGLQNVLLAVSGVARGHKSDSKQQTKAWDRAARSIYKTANTDAVVEASINFKLEA